MSRVKLEASLSPPPCDALATVSSVVREEVTDLNVHVKVESTPAKPRKRKRKGEADPKEPPPLKREARYRKSCVAAPSRSADPKMPQNSYGQE